MTARPLALTDAQLAQLQAGAATLRVADRDAFLRVARELAHHPGPPTDADHLPHDAGDVGVPVRR